MIVDTSAVLAILFDETDRATFLRRIAADPDRLMSAVNRVELTFVMEGRKGEAGRTELENFLFEAEIEIADVTATQAMIACEAFRRYGKGRHRAALNLGDSFAYALAKSTGHPLLFKGTDFGATDVTVVA